MHLPIVLMLIACTDKADDSGPWLLPPESLGADLATGSGLDLSDRAAVWNAADQLTPKMFWISPGFSLASTAFDALLDDEGITDEGTCPYTTASGPTLTWVSNCRSQDGYQLDGTVSRTDGDTDGRAWRLWSFDLAVAPRDEYPDLDRVSLVGQVLSTDGSGEDELLSALQVNLHVQVDGYLEAVNGSATQESIWSDWRLSARYELHEEASGTRLLMEGASDLGSLGGLTFSGTDLLLTSACPEEPDGALLVNGSTLAFDGSAGCDRCSQLELGGESVQICPPAR
jgi:hypothetical protein